MPSEETNGSPNLADVARRLAEPLPETVSLQSALGSTYVANAIHTLFVRRLTQEQKQAVAKELVLLREAILALAKPRFNLTGKIPQHLIGAMGGVDDVRRLIGKTH